jgi:hypothetical protein
MSYALQNWIETIAYLLEPAGISVGILVAAGLSLHFLSAAILRSRPQSTPTANHDWTSWRLRCSVAGTLLASSIFLVVVSHDYTANTFTLGTFLGAWACLYLYFFSETTDMPRNNLLPLVLLNGAFGFSIPWGFALLGLIFSGKGIQDWTAFTMGVWQFTEYGITTAACFSLSGRFGPGIFGKVVNAWQAWRKIV